MAKITPNKQDFLDRADDLESLSLQYGKDSEQAVALCNIAENLRRVAGNPTAPSNTRAYGSALVTLNNSKKNSI